MKNFIKTLSDNLKTWIYQFLFVFFSVLIADLMLEIIDMIVTNASFVNVIEVLLSSAVHIVVIGFALYAYKKQMTNWIKLFFVIYFAFILSNALFSVFDNLYYFTYNSTFFVFYGMFKIIMASLIVGIGLLTILDYMHKSNRHRYIVQRLTFAYLLLCALLFILVFVGIIIGRVNWTIVTQPIKDALLMLIFMGCYNYDLKSEPKSPPQNELVFDNGDDKTENEVEVEDE